MHAVSGLLVEHGGNILESQQFDDLAEDRFFMRVKFAVDRRRPVEALRAAFAPVAETWGMAWELWAADAPYRTLILVSKFSHCLNDLLFRWSNGSLQVDVAGVVSNHPDCEALVKSYGVPYHHVPVTPETKADAEATMLGLVDDARRRPGRAGPLHAGAVRRDLPRAVRQGDQHPPLVPAQLQGRPALPPGVRPRREAGRRDRALRDGDLDEGPIIEQDVIRVDHAYDAAAARRRRPRRRVPGPLPRRPLARRDPRPPQRPPDHRLPLTRHSCSHDTRVLLHE